MRRVFTQVEWEDTFIGGAQWEEQPITWGENQQNWAT